MLMKKLVAYAALGAFFVLTCEALGAIVVSAIYVIGGWEEAV